MPKVVIRCLKVAKSWIKEMTVLHQLSELEQKIANAVSVKGYRILLKAVELPDKTKGGIILTDSYKKMERRTYNVGKVLAMGHMCYQPLEKFGFVPHCEIGNWVHFSAYEREEVIICDTLCYYINDERVYSVIKDLESVITELR